MMSAFAIGDRVSLTSGGQAMNVESVQTESVACVWLDKAGKVRRDTFPKQCLRHGDSRFDGIPDLVIEGITHTRDELDSYLKVSGNA
jgi:uncharacterized protein YodC (DUF2158 family)